MREILDALAACDPPNARDISWLLGNGVPPLALARTWCGMPSAIRRGRVVVAAERRFEFAELIRGERSQGALIFLAHDRLGYAADLIAWNRHFLGSLLGRATLLGAEHWSAFRGAEAIPVYSDPLRWLQAERRGVAIVDEGAAAEALDGCQLIAEDIRHGQRLRRLLTRPAPRISVPLPAQNRQAA